MHLEKNRTYACTFPVQRKEINVVNKVRFTMRYSSRKLSNDKVITTACNFWRQIACSFQVMSGNILSLGNKIFEIPPFFQARPGDLGKKSSGMLITFFRPEPFRHFRNEKETWSRNVPWNCFWDRYLSRAGQQFFPCSYWQSQKLTRPHSILLFYESGE